MKERLQKILSAQGICSRRKAEELLDEGRVKVNGITASKGESADVDTDTITLDGEDIAAKNDDIYIMLNKPRGYVSTMSDDAGRRDITDLIADVGRRVFPIGRLDMHSEGLLLLTSDGALANRLTHPSHEVYKQYLVRMTYDGDAPPEPPQLAMSRSMEIDGQKLQKAKCRLIDKISEREFILTVSIREGKNRQIRRMCVNCGYTVNSLKRVAVGDLKLGGLTVGTWRKLTPDEIAYLKSI